MPAEAHRAYALLRVPEALGSFIDDNLGADDQAAAEVALPLAAKTPSTRLIVTRGGRGVTCLGAGMVSPAPTLVWAAVEKFLHQQDKIFRAQMALNKQNQQADNQKPLLRALRFGYRLTRAEYDAIVPLVPLFGNKLFDLCTAHLARLHELGLMTKRWPLQSDKDADLLWREHTSACLQMMLLDEHPSFSLLAFAALGTRDSHLSLRALWMLANRPERTLDALDALVADSSKPCVNGFGAILGVLFSRFPDFRQRTKNTYQRGEKRFGELSPLLTSTVRDPELAMVLVSALPLLLWRYPPRELNDPAAADAFAAKIQALQKEALLKKMSLTELAGRGGAWTARVIHLLDPLRDPERSQWWRPGAGTPDSKEERLRLVLWRAALRDLRLTPLSLPVEILAFLSLAPLEALLPAERPDPAWRVRAGRLYVKERLPVLLAR